MNISLFSITSGDVSFENSLTDSSLDFGFLLNSHSRYADAETMYSLEPPHYNYHVVEWSCLTTRPLLQHPTRNPQLR